MGRTASTIPEGTRLTDHISLGVIAKTFPLPLIRQVLAESGKASLRERALPAHVMVYYVIALALYRQASCREVLRCLLEGVCWLFGSLVPVRVASKSGISQARSRLGWTPLRKLYEAVVVPVAVPETRGAWYRGWHLVSLDGSTLDIADVPVNVAAFGRPEASRGVTAFPQIRFVSLVENGTHVLFGARMAGYGRGEITLAKLVLTALRRGMLCLADRSFFGFGLWKQARGTGADLLWRIKKNSRLPREKVLPDGSYLSHIYPSDRARRHKTDGLAVRVIEYRLEGVAGTEPVYRLLTTILDQEKASALELAALYHERWEIETALDEMKIHLRGARMTLRSETPDLVRQEFYGFLLAHFAIRGLMHEAALKADEDPDRLSFLHAVHVIRRRLPAFAAIPPSAQASLS